MSNDIEKLVDLIPIKEEKKNIQKDNNIIETIQEQVEMPFTTVYSPESVKDKELKNVYKNPQDYIEINILKKIRLVDTFYISSKLRCFHYKNKVYDIDEEQIYLFSSKSGFFMPTCFYYENNNLPISFKQTNIGITSKALSLLYDENLYNDLFSGDENKYNLFIVIFLIISVGAYLVGLYYLFKTWGIFV